MKAAHRKIAVDPRSCFDKYLPRIVTCLELLNEEQIWWRPNPSTNSAGNIVLHLCGNVRQWIISGLGGAPDIRERDKEFSEAGPISRRALIKKLKQTMAEASGVLGDVTPATLRRELSIQGY